jgi:hypothetical protein
MARRSRLWNTENVNEISDAQFSLRKQMQDAQPGTVGKCAKHQINLRFRHSSVYSLKRMQCEPKF